MERVELVVADIHAAMQPSEAFSLILKEKDGERYVPVIIGMSEARAILVEMNQSPTHRPLTHELFVSLADSYGCALDLVEIVHFENGVYYADMQMRRSDGTLFRLDARPSDAIALALKFHVPFYMDSSIFEANCMEDKVEDPEEYNEFDVMTNASADVTSDNFIDRKISEMSPAELQSLLEGAVESEDFELASKIQDEINRRKK